MFFSINIEFVIHIENMTDDDLDLPTPRLGAKVPEYKDESFLFPSELNENRHFRIKDISTNDKTKLENKI